MTEDLEASIANLDEDALLSAIDAVLSHRHRWEAGRVPKTAAERLRWTDPTLRRETQAGIAAYLDAMKGRTA